MSQLNSRHLPYLPEVDGLRAIAVLAVLLFHLGLEGFSGGFVGVDVFFVISGFLISKIIIKQVESQSFTLRSFYIRRARRILPALIFILVANFALAFLFFSPELFRLTSNSTAASIFFSSNILFYFQSSYFDTDAYLKPLLHTWSLGVEEQFYLFWPLVLYFLHKRLSKLFLVILFCTFLALSEFMAQNKLDLGFFIILFRVHEFMLGAALVGLIKTRATKNYSLEILNVTGLSLIIYSILTFNENSTAFPGLNSLIPCIGAVLCIYSTPAKYSGLMLNNTLMVKVGLISFSLYLIHWPIIVYYKYIFNVDTLSYIEMISISGSSIFLAALMYLYIEQPFRNDKLSVSSNKKFIVGCLILMTSMLAVSLHVSSNNGWAWRFNSDMKGVIEKHVPTYDLRQTAIRAPQCHHNNEQQKWSDYIKFFDQCNQITPNSTLVFGDSHAADSWLGLHLNLPNRNIIQVTGAACRFSNKLERCRQLFIFVQGLIQKNAKNISTVIYSQRGKYLDLDSIHKTSEFLSQLKNEYNSVYWLGPQMEYKPSISTQLSRESNFYDFLNNSHKWQKNELFQLDDLLNQQLAQRNIHYISKILSFCKHNVCPITTTENDIMYVERSHLTVKGTRYLTQSLLQYYKLKF